MTLLLAVGATVGGVVAPTALAASAATVSGPVVERPRTSGLLLPPVIAHRGASGHRPEHTLEAYREGVRLGAGAIEPDLTMTSDGVLVARHEPEIGGTTDVAQHPEFADRRTTRAVDGIDVEGWFVDDFTLAELRTLRAVERIPTLRPASATYDGRFPVPTFEEVLDLRAELSRTTRRTVVVVPELKHPTYLHARGLDPEAALVAVLTARGMNTRTAPVLTQSFEWTPLVALRRDHGYAPGLVFLVGRGGGPYDLVAAGTPRTYAEMTTPAALRERAQVVDVVAPDKNLVIPRRSDGTLGVPTGFVKHAHRAGLKVAAWTFRSENTFLPSSLRIGTDPAATGRMVTEVRAFLAAGTDAVFCDQPELCVAARGKGAPAVVAR